MTKERSDTTDEASPRHRPTIRDIPGTTGIVLTVIPVVLALIRIFVVARFDPIAVQVLLQTLNVPAIATDSMMLALPWACGGVVGTFGYLMTRRLGSSKRTYLIPLYINCLLMCVLLFLPPMLFIVAASCIFGSFLWILASETDFESWLRTEYPVMRLILKRAPPGAVLRTVRSFLLAVITLMCLGSIGERMNHMWLPAELVVHKKGKEVGYVLHAGDHDTTFMAFNRDSIRILRSEDIFSRNLCYQEPMEEYSILVNTKPIFMNRPENETAKRGSSVVPACQDIARTVPSTGN